MGVAEGDDIGERRDPGGALGEADLEGEGERNEEEYEQKDQRRQDDEPAARMPGRFHVARLDSCRRAIVRDKLGCGTSIPRPRHGAGEGAVSSVWGHHEDRASPPPPPDGGAWPIPQRARTR